MWWLSLVVSVSLATLFVRPDFEALYESEFDFVWRSLRRMGLDEASLDDAAQEVFIVAHRRLDDFEGRASPRTWLFAIARRVASDFRRWRRRKGAHEALPESLGDDGHNAPDVQAERREAAVQLERCVAAIALERREVFWLMEVESMAAPEVAEMLKIPVNTVYSRLRLARAEFEKAVARVQRAAP